MRADPQAWPAFQRVLDIVRAGDAAAARGQAGVDLESHGVRSRIDEAHLGIDALAAREEGGGGRECGQIRARRHIARGDAIAEAILQRDAQQRQRLRLCAAFLMLARTVMRPALAGSTEAPSWRTS